MTAIILIGAPGTGKSAIVAELAQRGWNAADVDSVIAARHGMSLNDFYVLIDQNVRNDSIRAELHAFFDDIESEPEHLWALAIPSDGLGVALDDDFADIRERLKRLPDAAIVNLSADLSTLVTRNGLIGPRSATMVMPRKEFRLMLADRKPVYDEVATHEYDTTNKSVSESAEAIISLVLPDISR
ncbi:shikimate kinase [Trueperella bonasi]|uniref:Shikimate kinase n=1 Tax=Trueperella bonasi TaxID=312286 RepID=A0ABT9NDN0_9ACTO|nr:shikimate kinase [Trueperella bonasi]MDP9805439.1 shikimate kinase [Trueperella bonasi]